ncbi:hypothetical protein CAMRE0001_2479 [Campylobacter rectus RM3267]|uniref:Uncharacterized protein n=1 Tax=Campylobacter rectus RM3267 TaxID=553218 RepID=B9D1X2_CAMRE|nr:hypothetical protein CAMRE0001_2479 [Campylobacter rectus RM3267]
MLSKQNHKIRSRKFQNFMIFFARVGAKWRAFSTKKSFWGILTQKFGTDKNQK